MTPAERANLEYTYQRLASLMDSGDIRQAEMDELYRIDDLLRPIWTQEQADYEQQMAPTIGSAEPTTVEWLAGKMTPAMQGFRGMFPGVATDERAAYQDAKRVAGLLDFVPFIGGGISADQARRDLEHGDYGQAAMNGAFSLLDIVPTVASVRKGIKPALSGVREGMIDVPDHPLTREYFARQLREAQASHGPIGRSVDVYAPDDYKGMKMAMRPEGDAGFAIKPDGEIASVLKHKSSDFRDFGGAALRRAEPDGGYWLNAFDTALTGIYGKNGFQPVSRLPFNENVARGDWGDEATDAFMRANVKYSGGRPDLVFMARDPAATAPITQGRGGLLTDDWDEAVRLLDERLKQLGYRK